MGKDLTNFKKDLTWEEKARENPLFAIMSQEEFTNSTGEPSEEQLQHFFNRGVQIWDQMLEGSFALAHEMNGGNVTSAEYGCGMGRTLSVPASKGYRVVGLDISETQLELAKRYFPFPDKISYTQIFPKTKIELPEGSLQFIYSYAVFQHISAISDVLFAFNELCRLLSKNGVLLIQVRYPNKFLSRFQRFGYSVMNSENSSLMFYFRKLMGIPLPVIRKFEHNHWSGAGCRIPYEDYIRIGEENGLKLNSIKFVTQKQDMIWLEFVKP